MILIKHIPRWVTASIQVFIQNNKGGNAKMFFEGEDRGTPPPDYIELRIDGPHMVQQTRTQFDFYVEVNIIITSKPDGTDLHKMARLQGCALQALQACIPVMKYGDGPDDNKEIQIGSLQRMETPKSPTDVSSFGFVESTQPIQQGAVAAQYMLCLTDV